jgi:hypothetical protein
VCFLAVRRELVYINFINSKLQRNYCSAQSGHRRTNPASRRRGDPISKHINGLVKNRNMVPTGPETKSDCAGEGQQHFTALLCSAQASKGYVTFL